jgi:hypothetical protein
MRLYVHHFNQTNLMVYQHPYMMDGL